MEQFMYGTYLCMCYMNMTCYMYMAYYMYMHMGVLHVHAQDMLNVHGFTTRACVRLLSNAWRSGMLVVMYMHHYIVQYCNSLAVCTIMDLSLHECFHDNT